MSAAATSATTNGRPVRTFYDIDGWFRWIDFQLFEALLASQAGSEPGTLVELGAYLGKSAVVVGKHLRPGEEFVVVDLFGDTSVLESGDAATRAENHKSYGNLTRQRFESNYLALHEQLPTVIQGPSSSVTDHVADGSVRFAHIDASHLYPHVRIDAINARRLLRPGGVVVFDDYRAEHTPGVSAAVWQAVFELGLIPIAVTGTKFYGCFTEPEAARAAVAALLDSTDELWSGEQEIAGHPVQRITRVSKPTRAAPPETKPAAATESIAPAELIERVSRRTADIVLARMTEDRQAERDREERRQQPAAGSRAEQPRDRRLPLAALRSMLRHR